MGYLLGLLGVSLLKWFIRRCAQPPLLSMGLLSKPQLKRRTILQPRLHVGVSCIGVIASELFQALGPSFGMPSYQRPKDHPWWLACFCIPHTRTTRIFLSSLAGDILNQWDVIRLPSIVRPGWTPWTAPQSLLSAKDSQVPTLPRPLAFQYVRKELRSLFKNCCVPCNQHSPWYVKGP